MNSSDVLERSAVEQAVLIRERSISPVELVQLYLDRIEHLDPSVNAFVTVAGDHALADAREKEAALSDGRFEPPPFFGVPIAIKDLDDTAGIRTTYSQKRYANAVPRRDTAVVRRLRQAGFVLLGKTNTPELGLSMTTESELNGPCRNPWDLSRTAGGSSGGSAAAVAAGMVPVATGSDGGGSIRMPASLNGLVGLKTARGRVSLAPGPGSILEGASTQGCLSRTVRDTAAVLDVLQGYESGDPFWAPPPQHPYLDDVGAPVGYLRIGVTTSNPSGGPLDPTCGAVVRDAAGLLSDLGHEVVEASPDWSQPNIVELLRHLFATLFAYSAPLAAEDLEPTNRGLLAHAQQTSSLEYVRACVELQLWARRIVAFWDDFDLLLSPTLALPAPRIGTLFADEEIASFGLHTYGSYTVFANITGQPAISLPLGWPADGLPVGVQLTGRPADEAGLIRIASQLEAARPWRDRHPPMWRS